LFTSVTPPGNEPLIVSAVFPDVPLIVLLTGIVACTGATLFHPAANACVRRFKLEPEVRLKANTFDLPLKSEKEIVPEGTPANVRTAVSFKDIKAVEVYPSSTLTWESERELPGTTGNVIL
jgi:hypothetical protein